MGVLQTKPQPLFRDEENDVDPNFNDGEQHHRPERHEQSPPSFRLNSHGEPIVRTLWKW